MVCVSKTVLVLHGFLAFLGGVQASVKGGEGADRVHEIFAKKENLICGSTQIRTWLTDEPSLANIRCGRWKDIEALEENYLKRVQLDIDRFGEDLVRLEKDLEMARQMEARDISSDEVDTLIKTSVEKVYEGGLSTAAAVRCGAASRDIRKQHGVKAKSYDTCKSAFKEQATEFFSQGGSQKVRATGVEIQKRCHDLMETEEHDQRSYCDDLCVYFGQEAAALSEKTAGVYAGKTTKVLQDQIDSLKASLRDALYEQDECRRAQAALDVFAAELIELDDDIKVKQALEMEARERLDMAEEALEEMEDESEEQESILQNLDEELGLANDLVEKNKGLKAAAAEAHKVAAKKALTTRAAVAEANKAFDFAQKANLAVLELKALVVQSLAFMWNSYEASLVRPIEGLNLAAEYFNEASVDLQEKQAVVDTLNIMDQFCAKTAIPVFSRIKLKLDLTPLCKFNKEEIAAQIHTTVDKRRQEIKGLLSRVQQRLNPYMNQEGMNDAEAAKLAEQGEPKGLRKIITVFGKSSYYKTYLSHWRMDAEPPRFLDLLKNVEENLAAAEQHMIDVEAQWKDLKKALADRLDNLNKMTKNLEDAVDQQQIAQDKKDAAEALLASQKEAIQKAEDDLDRLQRELDAAMAAHKAARDMLKATHEKATVMLQLFMDEAAFKAHKLT